MKKTSKILLGIIGGSWLLFICALFIPQCFEIEVERIDSDTTKSSPQAKTYTKEINSPFKHIVINSSSNYDIKIYCNTQTNGNAKNITQIQNKYYGKDLSSYKLVNDTLIINLATDENDETPSWLSSDLTITTPNNITEITSSPIINYIKIHNLKSEHLSIKNSDNEGDETNHYTSVISLIDCKIKYLNNHTNAEFDIVNSDIEYLHQDKKEWATVNHLHLSYETSLGID